MATYKPPFQAQPYNGANQDSFETVIQAPPIGRVDVIMDENWDQTLGQDPSDAATHLINQYEGHINQFYLAQKQNAALGGSDYFGAHLHLPGLVVRYTSNQGTDMLMIEARPTNMGGSISGSVDISGTYLVDIPFTGYPVMEGQLYGPGGSQFYTEAGGIGSLDLVIKTPQYFEVEIVKLPTGSPPTMFYPGDRSYFGQSITTEDQVLDITGETIKYPDGVNTFCTPFIGVGPANGANQSPGQIVKGVTGGGGFVGSGGNGFPRSVIVFPTIQQISTMVIQTWQPVIFYPTSFVLNHVFQSRYIEINQFGFTTNPVYGAPAIYTIPWQEVLVNNPISPASYIVGGTIDQSYCPAYATPENKAKQVIFGGFIKDGAVMSGTAYQSFRFDGTDFDMGPIAEAWNAWCQRYLQGDLTANWGEYPNYQSEIVPEFGVTPARYTDHVEGFDDIVYSTFGAPLSYPLRFDETANSADLLPQTIPPDSVTTRMQDDILVTGYLTQDWPYISSTNSTLGQLDSIFSEVTLATGHLMGDIFVGPEFKLSDHVDLYTWGKEINGPIGPLHIDTLLTTNATAQALTGPNAIGQVHSWVIKGSPTSIGNLSGPTNDLPIDNQQVDANGFMRDASGVWTGVDLGEMSEGDIIMVAVQPTTKTSPGGVWFGRNGEWKGNQPGGEPDAVLDHVTIPGVEIGYAPICGAQWGHAQLRFRYGRSMRYSPPAGFDYYGLATIAT